MGAIIHHQLKERKERKEKAKAKAGEEKEKEKEKEKRNEAQLGRIELQVPYLLPGTYLPCLAGIGRDRTSLCNLPILRFPIGKQTISRTNNLNIHVIQVATPRYFLFDLESQEIPLLLSKNSLITLG